MGSDKYYISRDNKDYFSQADEDRYTTYWAALRGKNEEKVGAIGLQLSQSSFYDLLPSTVLEEPYQLAFISIFESNSDPTQDKSMVWSYYKDSDISQGEWSDIVSKI